jgi:Tfp pilus assembly protein PilN
VVVGVLLGVLVIAIAGVLEHNKANDQRATLNALQSRVRAEQLITARLDRDGNAITRANAMAADLQQLSGSRFNWYSALTGFGELISPHTYFTSLTYTAPAGGATGATGSSASDASTGTAAATSPTFTLSGCTGSQDDAAQIIRQLRHIPGVVSVSESSGAGGVQLTNSQRPSTSKAAREGDPTTCSDTFAMSVQFADPTAENHGR